VVSSAVAPHITVEAPTNPVPVTVSVNAAAPATAETGLSDAMVGPTTANGLAEEDAALEFWTVTFCEPAAAIWTGVTAAVSEVALTKPVASGVVFHNTVDPPTKLIPVTVSVKAALPAKAEVELKDVIAGPFTANALAEEETVLEFCTVTFCGPAEASWILVTDAVSEVALP